ncbi:hypothetical protein EUGRSUZ_C03518 [Eucalyptus grandis]|uniref:Uncharacterized protein n=2 Tax=Eucalyptus grandis TaxID=71139 RepID=A0ACC3LIQ8_EUCGR|nr:hypothetical protein EUGRSUZ_C03518 [Eucalyptus grandis]
MLFRQVNLQAFSRRLRSGYYQWNSRTNSQKKGSKRLPLSLGLGSQLPSIYYLLSTVLPPVTHSPTVHIEL